MYSADENEDGPTLTLESEATDSREEGFQDVDIEEQEMSRLSKKRKNKEKSEQLKTKKLRTETNEEERLSNEDEDGGESEEAEIGIELFHTYVCLYSQLEHGYHLFLSVLLGFI